ncbi:hypothetical protein V9K67_00010 [Paraflavisolibacter sp. H34]|uniref:hypothetical protein n=1 Tax=Huijunlia imazamoxiresistens TaxID=3127457 RepID=UPI003016FE6F
MKVLLFVLFPLASCVTAHHVSTSHVPPLYEGAHTVLLVERLPGEAQANHRIRELLAQNYPFRYEIASRAEILRSLSLYRDTTVYRFAMLSNVSEGTTLRSASLVQDHSLVDYHIYDRATRVHYPATGYPAAFAEVPFETLMNTVLKALKERAKKSPATPAYSVR